MSYPTWPVAVRSIDIAKRLEPLDELTRYAAVRLFVCDGDSMLGSVDIWNNGADRVSVARLRHAIAERFGHTLASEEFARQVAARAERPPLPPTVVSIVVPTCNRPDDLRRCLGSLVAQRTRHTIEIIVVDNRPASGVARRIAREFPSVRVIDEARPGLSYARNAGILAATGTIVVATDDDVTAPVEWVERLVAPFVRADVVCVTGNVLPMEIETEAQRLFEEYGGLGKGFTPLEADGRWFRSRRVAVPTWQLGATANAAFRASIFREPRIGLLDEALGAGMPTGCSEDTYLFYRILAAGGTILYEPSAFVWHRHRPTMAALRQQIRAYSRGHVAYHLVTLTRHRDLRVLLRFLYSLPKHYAGRVLHRLRGWSEYPLSLILLEILGNLEGAIALWQARRRVKRRGRSGPVTPRPLEALTKPVAEQSNVVPVESSVSESSAI